MKPTEPFQEALYAEMLARIKEDDQSVPYRRGRHFYYSRTEKGKQYPINCRKTGRLEAPEEVTLDLNALAEGHPFLSLGVYTAERRRRASSPTPSTSRASASTRSSIKDLAHRRACCPTASRR